MMRSLSVHEPVLDQIGPEDIRRRLQRSTSKGVQRQLHKNSTEFFNILINLGWWLTANPCNGVDPDSTPTAPNRTVMYGPAEFSGQTG